MANKNRSFLEVFLVSIIPIADDFQVVGHFIIIGQHYLKSKNKSDSFVKIVRL